MSPTITIEAESIPSKAYSLTITKPLFKDYRKARMTMPSGSNQQGGPGYTTEELLFALSMHSVNGQPFETPRDIIQRIEPLSIKDRQFLVLAFFEAFFLDPADAKSARSEASMAANRPPESVYSVDKSLFPSGSKTITLNRPNTGVQYAADRKFQSVEANGCTLEEMLLAMCLASVNGQSVTPVADVISILDEWEIADVEFAKIYFINLFTLDDSGSENAKAVGKLMKSGNMKPKDTPKSKSTPVAP